VNSGDLAEHLQRRLALPRVAYFDEIGSTLDLAHELAEQGAPAGTLVLAGAQTAGRGRMGRSWRSESGAGLWLTMIERPADASGIDVLSLRIGLALAPALDRFASARVMLKWPNDLYVNERKLAGILVEARWRDGAPEWLAIGVGINLRVPAAEPRAIALVDGVSRDDVLSHVVPALRAAAAMTGTLSTMERDAFAARDRAAGRACVEPVQGIVRGIDANGGLVVDVGSAGSETVVRRAGSLVLQEEL
jgi:BirA family transcriptional regulator, biotin operon repressor / biotin---[acetyl-CoA-carboxylase] ligase